MEHSKKKKNRNVVNTIIEAYALEKKDKKEKKKKSELLSFNRESSQLLNYCSLLLFFLPHNISVAANSLFTSKMESCPWLTSYYNSNVNIMSFLTNDCTITSETIQIYNPFEEG